MLTLPTELFRFGEMLLKQQHIPASPVPLRQVATLLLGFLRIPLIEIANSAAM